jgi:hypothetical protein
MNKLVGLIILILVVVGAMYFLGDGSLPIIGGGGGETSGDAQALKQLQGEIREVQRQIRSAGRAAATGGLDSTHEIEDALAKLDRIESEIEKIKRETDSDTVKAQADLLLNEIKKVRAG